MLKKILSLLFVVGSLTSSAQIGLKPLKSNPTIIDFSENHPEYNWNENSRLDKWGNLDTLDLPFFDDFHVLNIYPDSSKWLNNYVFINSDFPILPPTIGVATFDFLDAKGFPYKPLNINKVGAADTLTSQAINTFKGIGGNYSLDDSIFLSFFYQSPGKGDFITSEDSFLLQFKNDTNGWIQVWGVSGKKMVDFKQVNIQLKTEYLHKSFQFRFVNISHYWGNNNQWHLDYVYLNKERGFDSTNLRYNDRAVQTKPSSLLKEFSQMPYSHFLVNPSAELIDTVTFRMSNLTDKDLNGQVRYSESIGGTNIGSSIYADNAVNMPAFGSKTRRIKIYKSPALLGFSGLPIVVDRTYEVRADQTPDDPLFNGNNSITTQQVFGRYFAYDDGTAESGFGFNDLRSGEGKIILEFELRKDDTLQAVEFFFTPNVEDVTFRDVKIQIWKSISINGGTDELVYETELDTPQGKRTIYLPEPIVLTTGSFYVGWSQEREFNLSVGFDKNNGYLAGAKKANEHIFFNVNNGGWIKNSNKDLNGAPMIRALVGATKPWNASNRTLIKNKIAVYPNPINGNTLNIKGIQNGMYSLLSNEGKLIEENIFSNSHIEFNMLKTGVYILKLKDKDTIHTLKLIKL